MWSAATCYSVKIPVLEHSELIIRFFRLQTALLQVSDSEIDRLLDRWVMEYAIRVENDAKLQSGMVVVGTDNIRLNVGCFFKSQRKIKGEGDHKLGNFGRGRSSIFHPTTKSQCVIHSLKAYKYLKVSGKELNADLEYELNKLLLPYNNYGLIYEEKPEGYDFDDLKVLENLNNMCVNVYTMTEKKEGEDPHLVIARVGNPKFEEVCHLLLVDEGSHMCLIWDFHKFMSQCTRSPNTYFCSRCLWGCKASQKDKIAAHDAGYCVNTKVTLRYPVKGVDKCVLKFEKLGRTYPDRCFAVFDTESYLEKSNLPNVVSTHKTIAWAYLIIDRLQGPICEGYYVGENAADLFLMNLERDWRIIRKLIYKYPLDKNQRAIEMLEYATACLMCETNFDENTTPVMHHDHAIPYDNIISILCSKCNLQLVDQSKLLTVIGHNSNRYDLNVLLRECKLDLNFRIHCKSGTEFHYLKNSCLKFIDSYAHLPGSLEKLADLHVKAGRPIPSVRYVLKEIHPDAHELLITGKQGFFYEFIDHPSKLDNTSLPLIEDSYSTLSDSTHSIEEYTKIQNLWEKAHCKNLRDLLIIYLLCDTAFLADVISSYRSDFYRHLGMDPIKHSSSASLAWHSMLKYSKIELDLITDDMSWFSILLSENIRGGLSQCFNGSIIKANHELCPDYDASEPKSYIYQLDMNALYSLCETFPLPTGNFKVEPESCLGLKAEKLFDMETVHTTTGFYLKVDVMVPDYVARKTDDLPLIINNVKITREMLSQYQIELLNELNMKFVPSQRLLASHIPTNEILMSAVLLKKLMQYGLVVTKVHQVISFDQRPFMKEFVEMNIAARIATSDPVLKLLLKNLNNSLYGRSILNIANHSTELHLIESPKEFMKRVMNPFFKYAITLTQNRMLAMTHKQEILQVSPLYIGFSILEASKSIMYAFWYETLKPFFADKISNSYFDTDSILMRVETENFEEEVVSNAHLRKYFDFSNFPPNHRYYSEEGKGQLGRVKSETGGIPILEAVLVRAKNYSLLMPDSKIKATLKGISKAKHAQVTHTMYKNAVLKHVTQSFEFGSIKVNDSSVDTVKVRRLGISPLDIKRYMLSAFESVCHGHPDAKSTANNDKGRKRTHNLRFTPKRNTKPPKNIQNAGGPKLFKSRSHTVDNVFFVNDSDSE